ncbi:MFS transporter [Sphingomonas sp. M1-B02]|uniref:MFS transporter n=1 Tax=Sphingomonas sp. M1-B02 TaxID=3114300 RepID=UPI0022409A9B|nr:MFS transporter [Sphingomonas sp. S6-11]UZK65432.1 MFS transporter [Sphingomonas sp. S6-11]
MSATPRRAVVAATIGNALEWFDLIIYAFFATAIAKTFFPNPDATLSLLIALGTFGVSFFVRPLGGIVLGAYADRAGRKAALMVGMVMMMVGTTLMALTPSAAQIGIAAPILIVLARLLQGFSAGGEFASATVFLAEQSAERRAFYSSWQFATQGLAMVLGSVSGLLITNLLPPPDVAAWGWRIPFLFGMLIGPVALYIRRNVPETAEFEAAPTLKNPLIETARHQKRSIAIAIGLVILCTVSIYMMLYLPTYSETALGLEPGAGFLGTLAGSTALFVLTPLFGHIADRIGRIPVALTAAVALVVVPVPLFAALIATPSATLLIATQAMIGLLVAAYLGALGALMTDLFPTASRSTGISLSYNISVLAFGGMAPLVITSLIARTGWLGIPSYYLAMAAVVSLIAILVAHRRGLR